LKPFIKKNENTKKTQNRNKGNKRNKQNEEKKIDLIEGGLNQPTKEVSLAAKKVTNTFNKIEYIMA